MNRDQIKSVVLSELYSIAPELEDEDIATNTAFRDQFDFDSMDFLNFVIGLHETLKIDIPESDYPKLLSLNGCVAYLESKDLPG